MRYFTFRRLCLNCFLCLFSLSASAQLTQISLPQTTGGVSGNSGYPRISGDGSKIVFSSQSDNIVPNDTNGVEDIFLYDRNGQTFERLSINSLNQQADQASTKPYISNNGLYVVYESGAQMVPGDSNSYTDIYLRDLAAGQTAHAGYGPVGVPGSGDSVAPSISDDARYVALSTRKSDLMSWIQTPSPLPQIMHYDRLDVTFRHLNVALDGDWADGYTQNPVMSADGAWVAFSSTSTELVAGDTNQFSDIFLYDAQAQTRELISVDENGQPFDSYSQRPSISADGRYVLFSSGQVRINGDTLGNPVGLVRYDRNTRRGQLLNTHGVYPAISPDGRYVAYFQANSGRISLNIMDVETSHVIEIRDVAQTVPGDSDPSESVIPGDLQTALDSGARHVVFTAKLDGLLSSDTNGVDDIFLYSIQHANISTEIEFLAQVKSAAVVKAAAAVPDRIEYKVTVSNLSNASAENVDLYLYFSMGSSSELYQDGRVVVSASGQNTISHAIGTIPANSSLEFKLRVELPVYNNYAGDFTIEASANAPGFDDDQFDNRVSEIRQITISNSQPSSSSVDSSSSGGGGGGCTMSSIRSLSTVDLSLLLLLGVFAGMRAFSKV